MSAKSLFHQYQLTFSNYKYGDKIFPIKTPMKKKRTRMYQNVLIAKEMVGFLL